MAVFIHREAKFNRRLETLKRGDKKSYMAAERARELITELFREDFMFLEEAERLTKHGELRIEKCRKYHLGSGYRLVCVKQGPDLVIAYVGTHDDCDRWIENNRRFEPELTPVKEAPFSTEVRKGDPPPPEAEPESEMDYDDILMQKIDDNMLRKIFWGLCEEES